MDYEKKYNEALERARKIHDEILNNELLGFPEQIREIFPELLESEDERIRKWLVDYFGSIKETVWIHRDITCEQILFYLEKQKEQKPVDYDHEMWKNCVANFAGGKKEVIEHPERYGLQKPAEWSEVELEFRGEKVTVKRPFYRDDKGRGYSTAELDEGVAWNALRAWCEKKGISLYDLYPKSEWSEEDEDMLNCCISSIEEAKENRYAYKETDGDTSYDREIAFLKSLRPSWKPSEEQMEALNYAIAKWDGGKKLEGLYALRTDLKKL